jgi:hypothetical protein
LLFLLDRKSQRGTITAKSDGESSSTSSANINPLKQSESSTEELSLKHLILGNVMTIYHILRNATLKGILPFCFGIIGLITFFSLGLFLKILSADKYGVSIFAS